MPIYVSYESKDYTPAPEGLHQAVCVDVIDLGLQPNHFDPSKPPQRKLRLVWQIDELDPDNGKRFTVMNQYTASLNPKASLRKSLATWRGRDFTEDELTKFDVENLIGKNCQIQIAHRISGEGKTFANVQAIVPAGKGSTPLEPLDYVRKKDREEAAPAATDQESEAVPF